MPSPKGRQPLTNRTVRERANIFVQRKSWPQAFDWHNVDQVELLTAMSVCSARSVTLSFAPAKGGIGVTVRIYQGNTEDDAYASCAEQLNELLSLLIAEYSEEGDDPRALIVGRKILRAAGD